MVAILETVNPARAEAPTYLMISLLAAHVRVLIVGGGRAGYVKAKTCVARGCAVTVVSPTFRPEFAALPAERLTCVTATYTPAHLARHQLVIIATNDMQVKQRIQADCEAADKLYLTCHEAPAGQFVMPVSRDTAQAVLAVHTKAGSPHTAVFIADKLQETLQTYDEFIRCAAALRACLQGRADRAALLKIIHADEFLALCQRGEHHAFCQQHDLPCV